LLLITKNFEKSGKEKKEKRERKRRGCDFKNGKYTKEWQEEG
jgi:hypothetical protein